jgi:hypothetical protein
MGPVESSWLCRHLLGRLLALQHIQLSVLLRQLAQQLLLLHQQALASGTGIAHVIGLPRVKPETASVRSATALA